MNPNGGVDRPDVVIGSHIAIGIRGQTTAGSQVLGHTRKSEYCGHFGSRRIEWLISDKVCSEKHYRVPERGRVPFATSSKALLAFELAGRLLAELYPTACRKPQLRGVFQIQLFSYASLVGIDRCDPQAQLRGNLSCR
jgi:hypothetical protein